MNSRSTRSSNFIPIVVGLILTVSFLTLGSAVYFKWSKDEEERFSAIRQVVAEQISESLKIPIWNLNARSIKNISNIYVNNTSDRLVLGITVRDEYGKVLNRVQTSELLENRIPDSEIFKEIRDIKYNDRLIGSVEITFSNVTTTEKVNIILSFLGIWFVFALFITLLTIGIILYHILIKPLEHFKSRAQLISKGDFRPIRETFFLEDLSSLAKTLNTALKEVNIRDEKLQKYNEELGEMINRRTQELYDQRERSHESERLAALGQMAAGIAHEVNNPLFIIQGNLGRLRKTELDESQSNIAEKIETAVYRISEIVKSMSTMARDGQKDQRQIITCQELRSIVTSLCEGRLRDKDIDFNFEFYAKCGKEDCYIYANKTQLLQVIVNLINNSIDAIEHLEKRVITVRVRQEDDRRFIDVIDSGPGIDKSIENRIMEPFFTTKDVNKGTGLGLSLSYEIMVKNGGYLQYDPKADHTTFIISLPKPQEVLQ